MEKFWQRIEEAAAMLHAQLEVSEAQARCWLTHSKRGTRIVVQRLADGVNSSVFVKAA
jgi:hypothetical protein